MDLNPRGNSSNRGNRGKSSLLPRNSFRGGPSYNFCPPPPHLTTQGPTISQRGTRDHSLPGALPPSMLGPPGNLDSLAGRTNFGRGDHLSMGVPDRGPLRNRDFAPSPPREMRNYRNDNHDYDRSGLLPHDYDSYRNYGGPHDFSGPPSGNYSFYGQSPTNSHFNYMHDQKMASDEPGGYAIPFHSSNNANDLYPKPQIPYNNKANKTPQKRKAQAQPFTCNVCNVQFNSAAQAAQHFSSVRHVKKIRLVEPGKIEELGATGGKLSKKQVFTCDCCKVSVNSLNQLEAHKAGGKHQNKMTQKENPGNATSQMETDENDVSFDKKATFTCHHCNVTVNSLSQLDAHKAGSKHQNKMQADPNHVDDAAAANDGSLQKAAVFTCEYCKVSVNSLNQLEAHKAGSKHQAKVAGAEPGKLLDNNDDSAASKVAVFTCECCNVNVNSLQQLDAHKAGSKHQNKMLQADPSNTMETNFVSAINNLKLPPSSEKKQSFTCVYCNISVNSLQQLEAHMSGSKHQAKVQKAQEDGTVVPVEDIEEN